MRNLMDLLKGRFSSSIRTKLGTAFTLLVAIISAFIFYYFPLKLEEQSLKSIAAKARSIGEMTSFSISTALLFDDLKTTEEALASARQNEDLLYVVVLDTTGRTVTSLNNQAGIKANYLDSESNQQLSDDGSVYRHVTSIISNGHEIGKLYIGLSLTGLKHEVSQSRTAVATISILIFLIGMGAAIGLSMVITKPLSEITATALEVAKGDLTQRVHATTNDEVGTLAKSFNRMIENIEGRTVELQGEIEQRKKAESVIREQAALLDVTKDAILVSDLENRILFWNKGAELVYGWTKDEVIGKDMESLFHGEHDLPLMEAKQRFAHRGEWQGEIKRTNKAGGKITVESRWTSVLGSDGRPQSILITDTDVTEKKSLEEQFLRSQRMESVGTLAGGIAHDLNNVLGPILLSVHLLKTRWPDEQSQSVLALVESSTIRAKDIIGQILSFARGVEGDRATIQILHMVKEFEKMIKDTFPRSIEIKTKYMKNTWTVSGDITQLYQVLMNLCVNARDAMPAGGRLEIEVENVDVDGYYAELHIDAKPGSYVVLTVTDTGTGIPPDAISKIFEPFFTTKEVGKGTGLGLSTTLGIIRSHNGFINVYSEMGKGTQFKVYLPATGITESQQKAESEPEPLRGKGELVLVVDDEEAVRQMQKLALEAYGYQVLTANDGTEAVAVVARHDSEIKVVITDMMMPFLDGASTIRALRKLNPRLKFIGVSGLMNENKIGGLAGDSAISFLQKPYTTEKLLSTLSQVIVN